MPQKWIIRTIDQFYPPFRKIMPLQTFRYAACGGSNTCLDIFVYFVCYNFILKKQIVHTPVVAISPHIAAIFLAFCISFPTGFFLMRKVVFTGSILRGRVQLIRYFSLVMVCLLLNYIFMKLFVEHLHLYPTVSKILTSVFVITFSYLSQKKFTFKASGTPGSQTGQ